MEILRFSFITAFIMFVAFGILGAIILWFDHKTTSIIMFVISGLCFVLFMITGGIFDSNNKWIEVKKYTEKAVVTAKYSEVHREQYLCGRIPVSRKYYKYYIDTKTEEGEDDTWEITLGSYEHVEKGQQIYVVTHFYETEYTHDTRTDKTWWYE